MQSVEQDVAHREKSRAALSSVVAAVLLTALKLAVGILSGSLGILAEAAHSGLDLVAALVTFFAVRISSRPPDEQHPYGHGKVENLSALFETLLLLATCVWIIYEAVQRLLFKGVEIDPSIWAFGVMVISIIVDYSRSRVLYSAAHRHKSQALEADALHFQTDIWSSSVVILGLGLVWLAERLGPRWAFLAHADAVAALVVAGIVVVISLQLGRRSVMALLDTAPQEMVRQVEEAASQVAGVSEITDIRLRESGPAVFVDLTLSVDRSRSLEEAHQIASEVEEVVLAAVPGGDAVVHVEPRPPEDEPLEQTLRALAAQLGIHLHNIHTHRDGDALSLDLHAELDEGLTLQAARERLAQFEERVRADVPTVRSINAHIEPCQVPLVAGDLGPADAEAPVAVALHALVAEIEGVQGWHGLQVRPTPEGLDVVVHCTTDPHIPVAQAHRLADQVERGLQERVGGLGRVLVHME